MLSIITGIDKPRIGLMLRLLVRKTGKHYTNSVWLRVCHSAGVLLFNDPQAEEAPLGIAAVAAQEPGSNLPGRCWILKRLQIRPRILQDDHGVAWLERFFREPVNFQYDVAHAPWPPALVSWNSISPKVGSCVAGPSFIRMK